MIVTEWLLLLCCPVSGGGHLSRCQSVVQLPCKLSFTQGQFPIAQADFDCKVLMLQGDKDFLQAEHVQALATNHDLQVPLIPAALLFALALHADTLVAA